MKLRIILLIAVAILISSTHVFGQEVKPNEKQAQIQLAFEKEAQKLYQKTVDLVIPFKAQKYDIDERIADLWKQYNRQALELKKIYDQKYDEAGKIEPKKEEQK
ncbi:MAG: hypothetical protein UT94_C0055G0006 [Candidatus Uhrbacteria bacterium GW2011_GWF2_40_263]|nr:MAG: hypothetical protein UT94_C0055G0006 [Candidatus Uhrbacteria bacterium GW2011_GWF2_40_263]